MAENPYVVPASGPTPAAAVVRPVLSWVLCVLMSVALLVGVVAILLVPRFEAIFRDLNIKLPLLTGWVLAIGRWHGWIALLAVAAAGIGLEFRHGGGTWKVAANAIGLVVAMILAAAIVVALFLPLIMIIDQLNPPPP